MIMLRFVVFMSLWCGCTQTSVMFVSLWCGVAKMVVMVVSL